MTRGDVDFLVDGVRCSAWHFRGRPGRPRVRLPRVRHLRWCAASIDFDCPPAPGLRGRDRRRTAPAGRGPESHRGLGIVAIGLACPASRGRRRRRRGRPGDDAADQRSRRRANRRRSAPSGDTVALVGGWAAQQDRRVARPQAGANAARRPAGYSRRDDARRCLRKLSVHRRPVPPNSVVKTAVRARAQVHHYPCDHFDVWPGHDWFDTAVAHQIGFLGRTFGSADRSAAERAAAQPGG